MHFCKRKQTGGKLAMFTEWLEAEGGSFAELSTTHWGETFFSTNLIKSMNKQLIHPSQSD